MSRSPWIWNVVLFCVALLMPHSVLRAAESATLEATGAALETIFSPDRSPPNKTMGLVQRNFLDLVEESKSQLQIALVLDGTSSMTDSLASVKATLNGMMEDLSLYKEADVAYQLVVYRDIGADSGEVAFPLVTAGKRFSTDREAFQRALDLVQPETGAPYFLELIDAGIHEAIQQLEWATDEETSKWVIVIGDAPPFEKGFQEAETGARRRFDEQRLVSLATSKGIRINCILVPSRPSERETYEQVLDTARQFMNTVSAETGGLMLDLSYPDIKKAILAAAEKPRPKYTSIGKIEQAEIEKKRAAAEQRKSAMANSRRAKLAVLPHLEFQRMSFRADLPEVKLAADLRRRLREIPGVDVKSSRFVRSQFQRLARQGLNQNQMLQMLATRLGVDYVVWGEIEKSNGLIELSSAIYRKSDGKQVGSGRGSRQTLSDATTFLVADVVNRTVRQRTDMRLVNVLSRLRNDNETIAQLRTPVSSVQDAIDPLLESYEELEQALSVGADDPDAERRLKAVREKLEKVIQLDATSPIAQQLLASCCFGQAQIAQKRGDDEAARGDFARAKAALERAKRIRNHPTLTTALRAEIGADYALLAQRKFDDAVRLYEQLLEQPSSGDGKIHLHLALRAHWMLAGLRCGDWGAAGDAVVDPEKAREHLVAILAFWPESPEATYIRGKLRWDQQKAANSFAHYPHQGPAFLDGLE